MGRVMSARLDRARPLWEYWLVEGLAGGRWALISKVHHCMVDGVSGTDLYRVVLDPAPSPRPPAPGRLAAASRSRRTLALDRARALGDLARAARSDAGARRWPAPLRSPGDLGRPRGRRSAGRRARRRAGADARLVADRAAVGRAAVRLRPRLASRTSRAVRHALGGTFNDVVLDGRRRRLPPAAAGAAASGRRPHPSARWCRSTSGAPGEESIRDNRVSLDARGPAGRGRRPGRAAGRASAELLGRLKAEHEADAGAASGEARRRSSRSCRWPRRLRLACAPAAASTSRRSRPTCPGPREPLYALGRRCWRSSRTCRSRRGCGSGVAIFTYAGPLTFGVTGDYDVRPRRGDPRPRDRGRAVGPGRDGATAQAAPAEAAAHAGPARAAGRA